MQENGIILSSYEITSFESIPLWRQTATLSTDGLHQTWSAFQRNFSMTAEFPFLAPCAKYKGLSQRILSMSSPTSGEALLSFMETHFDPYQLPSGKPFHLTGYYLPVLEGSLEEDPNYPVPIFGPPKDLLFIPDLGPLLPELAHTRWAGRKNDHGQIVPYFTRFDINQGALRGETPLLWLKSEIDAYFLHIQGSGKIQLPNGDLLDLRYVASNGHPYHSVGNKLIALEKLPSKPQLSSEIFIDYLKNLPPQVLPETLSLNPSYIFFEILINAHDQENPGPWGTFGTQDKKISLTPLHSAAIDPVFIPLGLPLWLSCSQLATPLLCCANDTGGGIKGPGRMDLYCGQGHEGLIRAGPLNHSAQVIIFKPKNLT